MANNNGRISVTLDAGFEDVFKELKQKVPSLRYASNSMIAKTALHYFWEHIQEVTKDLNNNTNFRLHKAPNVYSEHNLDNKKEKEAGFPMPRILVKKLLINDHTLEVLLIRENNIVGMIYLKREQGQCPCISALVLSGEKEKT